MSGRRSGLTPRRPDRGQSISVNYTLSLVIVSVLISGLFIAMSGYLDGERERVTRSELDVLGNRIAADIATADRLASTTGNNAEVQVRTDVPDTVAGTEYTVTITSSPSGTGSGVFDVEIQLTADAANVARNVSLRTEFEVTSSFSSGAYVVKFDGSTLEVTNG